MRAFIQAIDKLQQLTFALTALLESFVGQSNNFELRGRIQPRYYFGQSHITWKWLYFEMFIPLVVVTLRLCLLFY